MYTRHALLDIHERTHRSLLGLIDHCASFEQEALERTLDGFGYPTVLQQLHHVVGAERYWLGVLQGQILVDEHEADWASIDAVRAFHDRVVADTRAYLEVRDDAALSEPAPHDTWNEKQVMLSPAHVILRTQTHVFQHQGQVAAMCRLLGRPIPAGLDFPIRAPA